MQRNVEDYDSNKILENSCFRELSVTGVVENANKIKKIDTA